MSKKLVIRINNLQDIETSDDYEVAEETSIRWDRVILAAVIAVFLLVALVWSAWYLFSSEESTHEAPIFEAVSEPVTTDADPRATIVHVSEETHEHGNRQDFEPLAGVEKVAEKSSIAIDETLELAPQTIVADKSQVEVADASVVNVEKPAVEKTLNDSSESVVDKPSDVSAVSTVEEAPIKKAPFKAAPSTAAAFVDPIVIESNRIVKAQLTHGVNKSEPVDRLGNVVSMNADKLIKVYLFTGMEGLKGETLYHDWYLSGKKMARVKIKVRSNQTSASSSKFIDQYMMGDWKVQVTTSRGDELVSARFNVTP